MHSLSLVCFTLLTQSAVGLVWASVMGHWFGGGSRADFSVWSLITALILTGFGLYAALAHLSKPRLAPHAFRNLAASWLSREVVLVQIFTGTLVLLIGVSLLGVPSGLFVLETMTCLTGGAALFAMTRVYRLKTVPVWNTPATPLEFAGSAILLGGALSAVFTATGNTGHHGWNPGSMAAGICILTGLILKLAAIPPALAAEQAGEAQTWYAPTTESTSTGRTLVLRFGLNLTGLALILPALNRSGPAWLWSCLALICFAIGEVMGRLRFYKSYGRLGL